MDKKNSEPNWVEFFGKTLISKEGEIKVDQSTFQNVDYIGVYFTCISGEPCKVFAKVILDRYTALNAAGKKFQVVFIDAGDDYAEFQENFSGMPWLALPHSNEEVNMKLYDKFQSSSVPHLAIVQVATGETITIDAVPKLTRPNFLEEFPFPIKKLSDIR